MQYLDQPEISEIAIQPRRGALACLLNWMNGKLNGDPAHFANTFAHALCQHQMVAVARG